MSSKTTRARALLIGLVAALAITSCGSDATSEAESATEEAVRGGSLDLGIDIELNDLDPAGNEIGQQSSLIVANAVYEPLFVDGPEGAMEPRLAETIDTEDALNWTLTLREGLSFSDGSPLDAEAIVDHIERIQGSESATALSAAEIETMEVVDDITVNFTLVQPNSAFDRYFSRNLGMIASTTESDDLGNPLGAGPFTLESIDSGSSLTLARNEEYSGTPAYLDQIVVHFLPDGDSRYQSLLAGTMDLIWTQTPNHFSSAPGEGLKASAANATTATAIFNVDKEPFDDVRVRQAIQAAIDREVLSEVVDQGQGSISNGPLSSRTRYAQDINYPEYDPEHARELLADYGEPVSLEYSTDSSSQSLQRATAIQQMLGEVGVDVEIDVADTATWGANLFERDFELIEFVTSGYGDADTVWALFESESDSNFGGYSNADVDNAVVEARSTVKEEDRAELYGFAAQTIVDEAPTLFFTESPAGFVSSEEVSGVPDLSDRNVISPLPGEIWMDNQ